MNRKASMMWKWIAMPIIAGALCVFATTAMAQPAPRGDGAGSPNDDPAGPAMQGRPDGPGRPDGMGRPDRLDRAGAGMRPMPPEAQQIERMRGYLDIVDRFSRLSRDPSATGVAAVITAGDILKPRGSDAAIEFFNKTLPNVKDPAVQRAIRLQLIDLYKVSGQQDKAMEQLTQLITSATPAPGDVPATPSR